MSGKNIEDLLKKLNHNIFLWLLTNSRHRHMFSSLVVLDYDVDNQHLFFDINNKTIPFFFSISKSAWYSKIRVTNCTRLCIGNDLLNICKDYFRFSQRLACRNQ